MASALQCPACGCKHRLSGLSGEPVFACAQCGRLLKTPAEYLRPEPSGPAEAPRPSSRGRVQRGGSATRDQTSVIPATGGAAVAAAGATSTPGASGSRPRRPGPQVTRPVPLPVRIIAWIAAVAIGAYVVRYIARAIGWLTGDSLIDVITGSGIGRYLRVFALVPFWALATAALATLFIEGGRWWQRRRAITPGKPPRPIATRKVPPAPKAAGAKQPPPPVPAKPKPRPRQPTPRPVAEQPAAPEPRPEPRPAPRPAAPSPAAAESRTPSGAAGAPRPRRIPRRDVTP